MSNEPQIEFDKSKCPYCHDSDFKNNYVYCPKCGAKQHKSCLVEHEACASCRNSIYTNADVLLPKQANKIAKPGIAATKLIMGIIIIAAFLCAAIIIPPARPVVAIMVLFGFTHFLEWLGR